MSKELLKILVEEMVTETIPDTKPQDDIGTKSLPSASKEPKKLRVFDLDDTLVKTQSKVIVKKANGEKQLLTPGEYAVYEKEPGDEFDFSHFEDLVDPTEIRWTAKILRRIVNKRGVNAAVILTARSTKKPAETFFKMFNIPPIPIVALGDSDPQAKAQWILYVIKKFNYDVIEFFDDSVKNIAAVQALAPKVPNTKIIARLIEHK